MAAGIVLKTKFLTASAKGYSGYIQYIDRPEAIADALKIEAVTEYDVFGTYADYMGNPEKSTGLFTADRDTVSAAGKEDLKALFQQAQKKGGLMYQTLFSFESKWLKENGLMEPNGQVVEDKLREYTRKAVACLMKEERMDGWPWSAAVHYNTKHVHIHIAMADPYPSWEEGQGRCRRNRATGQLYQRGKLKPKTLEKTKAAFVNLAIRSKEENEMLNQLIRERIVLGKKSVPFSSRRAGGLYTMMKSLLAELPEDMRLWRYNMAAMKPYQSKIDALSRTFLETHFADEYAEFKQQVAALSDKYAKSYGDSKLAKSFSLGKEQDLYARLGNAILTECRSVRHEERRKQYGQAHKGKRPLTSKIGTGRLYYAMRGLLRKDIQSMKNQAAYKRLQEEQEQNKI